MDSVDPPDPTSATTADGFVTALARFRVWSGNPSLRKLQQHAERPEALPPTTVSWILSGKGLPRLPRWEFVAAFVTACLRYSGTPQTPWGEVERWRQAWRTLARGQAATVAPTVPAQLPAPYRHFTGRETELNLLDTAYRTAGGIVAIVGPGGVGKTALAASWAHQHKDQFPDGQLYADLRGFHPDRPISADVALTGMLTALGVRPSAMPDDLPARSAFLRTLCADRRLLIILDNARDGEHVRPLLPGSASCLVLVTSRDTLAGLVGRDGATRIRLGRLADEAALRLVNNVIRAAHAAGPAVEALRPGPDSTELVDLCGGLPLALCIAGERAANGHDPIADVIAGLRDETRRLDLLSPEGDPQFAIRTVIEWSYRDLDPGARELFQVLSLHPGESWPVEAAAALAGVPVGEAASRLDLLARRHLVEHTGPQRYRLHDLVHAFAAERLRSADDDGLSPAAAQRLSTWYRHMITGMTAALDPAGYREPSWPGDVFSSARQALAWGQQERATLRRLTTGGTDPELVCELAVALGSFYRAAKYTHDWIAVNRAGLVAARRCGDQAAQARLLTALGHAHLDLGQPANAAPFLAAALPLRAGTQDQRGLAVTLNSLAIAHRRTGRLGPAARRLREALTIQRAIGDRGGQALTLNNLGNVARDQGRFVAALRHLTESLTIEDGLAPRGSRCIVLCSLGETYHAMAAYDRAAAHFSRGLRLAEDLGDEWQQATLLAELGHTWSASGEPEAARDCWQRAERIFAARDDPRAAELRAHLTGRSV
ncbi:tetratricopeptide repeat protein [Hamadaea sp. NPDC051192]|uniref:ATP-binding protein n=1 Tax=Hamadaea sp. NPDC051192 TaxID=3154940 RepID=UPI0034333C63